MKASKTNFTIRMTFCFAIATMTLLASQTVHAALLNGSFEFGVAYPGGRIIFSPGTPVPWSATSLTPDCYDNASSIITDGWSLAGIPAYGGMFQNMLAASGNRFLGFAAGLANGGSFTEAFSQTTAPLTGGQTYTISAALAAEDTGKATTTFGGPYTGRGKVDVYLNNNLIGTLAPNTASLTWQQRSFSFVAPTASTAVFEFRAAFANSANPLPSYIGIDTVRLTPEPSTFLLMSVCLAGVLSIRRRSQNA